MLLTLGGLRLEGSRFSREKPLLLLAYLALEGPKPRRFLAELFWPEATDPMNSLAVALSKLRKLGTVQNDASRAWVNLDCDALRLQDALRAGRWAEGVAYYRGAFAEGLSGALGKELEEWVFEVRERLALEVRQAFLILSGQAAAQGRFAEAAVQAEQACRVAGAPPLEPEDLTKLHRLLIVAGHPLSETLEREARELGLVLSRIYPQLPRAQPRLVGREGEIHTLLATLEGEWVWLRGRAGMGKTALLREVEARTGWAYLSARSGLPYATLEPLLDSLEGGPEAVLRRLAASREHLLLDGWEEMDPESRALIEQLRRLRPPVRVILAGRGPPPFAVERVMELGPLTPQELAAYPGVFEATRGAPALVGNWLRGEPLGEILETRLAALSEPAREVYMALALLENPDLPLVRRAVGLSVTQMAQAMEGLLSAGLISPNGEVFGREAALRYTAEHPAQEARLSLGLARGLKPQQTLPLYRRAKDLIADSDLPQLLQAYITWAQELIRRGFPKRAAEELAEAPSHPEIVLLRTRALERAGLYEEALEAMQPLPDTPEHLALKASLYQRLGQAEQAQQAAQGALAGGIEARASGQDTLGLIHLAQGRFAEATVALQQAAALWLASGDETRRLGALSNLAIARARTGERVEEVFGEVLDAARDHKSLCAQVLINLGKELEQQGRLEEALQSYQRAEQLALEIGHLKKAALAQNNTGALLQLQGQLEAARCCYHQAIAWAREAGEVHVLSLALSNLAELTGDIEVWQEAIAVLESAGYFDLAEEQRQLLKAFMERSG